MRDTGSGKLVASCQAIKAALFGACGAGIGLAISRDSLPQLALFWLVVLFGALGFAWWSLKRRQLQLQDSLVVEAPVEPAAQLDRRVAEAKFLSSTSHDLRQPVQAIALFSATLATHPLPQASRKLVAGIETAVESLSEQMETVFSIAKADAGRIEPVLKPVRLGDVFSSSVAAHLEAAHEAGLHLRHVETRCSVLADEALLVRSLDAMLGHALQVTRNGGIVLGCRRNGPAIFIDVWDSSPGIEPELLPGIFDVGNDYGVRLQDHGLALVLAARLARLMGGSLHAQSWPGKGNLLRLQLPRA